MNPTYDNLSCDRCGASKAPGTPIRWCTACDELPTCPHCSEPTEDCEAGKGGWPCSDDDPGDEDAWERKQLGLVQW